MSTIILKKDSGPGEIEEMHERLDAEDNLTTFRLPNTLKCVGDLGIEAQVIQLMLTWIRKFDDRSVFHSYVREDTGPSGFEDLCSRMYGICALSLSGKVLSTEGQLIKRGLALQAAARRIEALRRLNFRESFKGSYLGFPHIKTVGYENELVSPFYNGDRIVNRDRFYRLTLDSLRAATQNDLLDAYFEKDMLLRISSIIYEWH